VRDRIPEHLEPPAVWLSRSGSLKLDAIRVAVCSLIWPSINLIVALRLERPPTTDIGTAEPMKAAGVQISPF
jgi:hypothetical protein